MDAAHREALRAWREDPGDPEALAALVTACRRAGESLPPEADPALLVADLADRVRTAYGPLGAPGYDYVLAKQFAW
ncbi:MAG: hypothetical protein R3F62_13150 [Planctomycetota bacterium]